MLRLMDANLDRLSEGLRVLEDVCRFILGDARMTETLKRMRHELTSTDPDLRTRLLAARDAVADVGREGRVTAIERTQLTDLVTANARRAQESLRVLEEFAKLPEIPDEVASRDFERARFALYEIGREMVLRLTRQDKRDRIHGLYAIVDAETLHGRSEAEVARQVIEGGAGMIQYRDKTRDKKTLISVARELKEVCARAAIPFIINDSIEIALAINADGVHLGQDDLPIGMARELLPLDKIIGCSARTVAQALQAEQAGADYIGVGAVYASPTKPDAEVIGLDIIREIREAVSIPIVAIGGITENNVQEVIHAGADAFAVIGAILGTEDVAQSARRLTSRAFGKGDQ